MYHEYSLTPDELRIIEHKETEPPFSGEYYDCDDNGVMRAGVVAHHCIVLWISSTVVCGWPSFDADIPLAVKVYQMLMVAMYGNRMSAL